MHKVRLIFLGFMCIASLLVYAGRDEEPITSPEIEEIEFDLDMMLAHPDCMKDQFCVGWYCYYTVGYIYRFIRCRSVCPDEPEEQFIIP